MHSRFAVICLRSASLHRRLDINSSIWHSFVAINKTWRDIKAAHLRNTGVDYQLAASSSVCVCVFDSVSVCVFALHSHSYCMQFYCKINKTSRFFVRIPTIRRMKMRSSDRKRREKKLIKCRNVNPLTNSWPCQCITTNLNFDLVFPYTVSCCAHRTWNFTQLALIINITTAIYFCVCVFYSVLPFLCKMKISTRKKCCLNF